MDKGTMIDLMNERAFNSSAAGCIICAIRALDEASPRLRRNYEMRQEVLDIHDRLIEICNAISSRQKEICDELDNM